MNTEREADFRLPSLMRQNSPAATKRTGRRTPPPGYGRQNSPSVLRQNGPSVTLERLENRKKYLEKGERTKRTHRLCNLGGTIESLAPEVKDLTRTEMTELMEHIFSLSEVQRAVRHMAITHISQANREKELKADGTISSERHAD